MTPTTSENRPTATWYQIRIKGHLDDHWVSGFEGMTLTRDVNGETLFTGAVIDQAALYGMLRKVRDLGLPLISVIAVEQPPPDPSDSNL